MDWPMAITRNRDWLRRIIAELFAMAGLAEGAMAAVLPRHVYCAMLNVLRPAESALRRIVMIAARGLVLAARASRPFPSEPIPRGGGARTLAFCLIDPLKVFGPLVSVEPVKEIPRISVPGLYDPAFTAPKPVACPDDLVSAAHMCRRLNALKRAMDDLPAQARRLARWQARRDLALQNETRVRRLSPFRPGRPPGHRQRSIHEVDDLLRECHWLALHAREKPDTS